MRAHTEVFVGVLMREVRGDVSTQMCQVPGWNQHTDGHLQRGSERNSCCFCCLWVWRDKWRAVGRSDFSINPQCLQLMNFRCFFYYYFHQLHHWDFPHLQLFIQRIFTFYVQVNKKLNNGKIKVQITFYLGADFLEQLIKFWHGFLWRVKWKSPLTTVVSKMIMKTYACCWMWSALSTHQVGKQVESGCSSRFWHDTKAVNGVSQIRSKN